MNPEYSNDPQRIGNYYSNTSLLMNNMKLDMNAFSDDKMLPCDTCTLNKPMEIMKTIPRSTVPEQDMPIGTKVGKSCNLPGIEINRFENPNANIQNPGHIIRDEPFRGGIPSRTVSKDEFFNNNKSTYQKKK